MIGLNESKENEDRFHVHEFSDKIEDLGDFLSNLRKSRKIDDLIELRDIMDKTLELSWDADYKLAFLISDEINYQIPSETEGQPNGVDDMQYLNELMYKFNENKILFSGFSLHQKMTSIFEILKKSYDGNYLKMEVHNFNQEVLGSIQKDEIDRNFEVKVSEVITRHLGKKVRKRGNLLWNGDIAIGDWFSFTQIVEIISKEGNLIGIRDQYNREVIVPKEQLN